MINCIKAASLMMAILLSTNTYSAVDQLIDRHGKKTVAFFYGAVGGYSVKCENFRDGDAHGTYGRDLIEIGVPASGQMFDDPSIKEGWYAAENMTCKQTKEGLIETGLYKKFF